MSNLFEMLLKVGFDKNSANAEYQKLITELKKNKFEVKPDINFAKSKQEIEKQVADIAKIFKDGLKIDDKSANKYAKSYYNEVVKGAKAAQAEQSKLVDAMAKAREISSKKIASIDRKNELAQSKAINKSIEDEYKSNQSLASQMAKVREQSELRVKSVRKGEDSAQVNSINKALENQYALVRKINEMKSSGRITTDFSKVSSDFNNLTNKTTSLKTAFQTLQTAKYNFERSGNNQALIANYHKYNASLQSVRNQVKQLTNENQKLNQSDAFSRMKSNSLNKIDTFLKQNTALTKESRNQFLNLRSAIEATGDVRSLRNLNGELTNLQRTVKAAGETGRSFGDELKNNFQKFSQWVGASAIFFGIQRAIRKTISSVAELDKAMTSLYKVTDETDKKYTSFLQGAFTNSQKLGQSVSSLVEQTAQWAKLGYNIDDAANLARTSSVYANVGEVDNKTAVSDMVTALKAYNIESSKAITIVDSLNELGNKYATSAADLGEGLKNSASALALGGMDINKSLALLTGGAEITQNAGELGNALKVGQMRVMSMKGALEELGEEYEDLESVSKMQTKILNLTNGQVNIMNDADPTKFKDYYDILEGVAKVYKDLEQPQQMDLLETLFGKMRGNQGSAVLQAFMSGQVQKALESAQNSAGSAMEEQNRWMQSIEAKTKQLSASAQEFSNTFLSSSTIKGSVDGMNLIITGLTNITKLLGTIPTLATIAFGVWGAKGHGKQLCF